MNLRCSLFLIVALSAINRLTHTSAASRIPYARAPSCPYCLQFSSVSLLPTIRRGFSSHRNYVTQPDSQKNLPTKRANLRPILVPKSSESGPRQSFDKETIPKGLSYTILPQRAFLCLSRASHPFHAQEMVGLRPFWPYWC